MQRILIIDDSAFDRRMISSAMKSNGDSFEFVELSHGKVAVETIKALGPDLTVLDIRMPGKSGFDVLDEIRAEKSLQNHKVIVMSGSSADTDKEMAAEKGASAYFTKPSSVAAYRDVASEIKHAYLELAG